MLSIRGLHFPDIIVRNAAVAPLCVKIISSKDVQREQTLYSSDVNAFPLEYTVFGQRNFRTTVQWQHNFKHLSFKDHTGVFTYFILYSTIIVPLNTAKHFAKNTVLLFF